MEIITAKKGLPKNEKAFKISKSKITVLNLKS